MIDRLPSLVNGERLRSLERFLTRKSGEERSSEEGPVAKSGRDTVWTSEELVVALLDENGGRMWQQSIVSETGYSEAQVSRLLGRLEADDIVDRHWVRGQKVVVLDRDSAAAVPPELASPP